MKTVSGLPYMSWRRAKKLSSGAPLIRLLAAADRLSRKQYEVTVAMERRLAEIEAARKAGRQTRSAADMARQQEEDELLFLLD